jgi:hypothetical protein
MGVVFFEFGYEKEEHLKQSSIHGATWPLESRDGETCHLAHQGTFLPTGIIFLL